jgi:hypothetical protein
MAKLMRTLVLKTHGDLGNLELVEDYPIPPARTGPRCNPSPSLVIQLP